MIENSINNLDKRWHKRCI